MVKQKYLVIILMVSVLGFTLMGCDNRKIPKKSQIKIEDDKSITSSIVESFNKDYYDFSELKEWINNEILQYNELDQDSSYVQLMQLLKIEETSSVVSTLKYSDYNAYANFNNEVFFVGTIEEALDLELELPNSLNNTKNNDKINKSDLLGMPNYNLVVWCNKDSVVLPSKILYYSDNVKMLSSKEAVGINNQSEHVEEIYYLLYK